MSAGYFPGTKRFSRALHTTPRQLGLMPESSDPPAPATESHDVPTERSEMTLQDYHERADQFMERLLARLEERQDEKGDLEAEYAVREFPTLHSLARSLSCLLPQAGRHASGQEATD
jgi:hypothetical protein